MKASLPQLDREGLISVTRDALNIHEVVELARAGGRRTAQINSMRSNHWVDE